MVGYASSFHITSGANDGTGLIRYCSFIMDTIYMFCFKPAGVAQVYCLGLMTAGEVLHSSVLLVSK